MKNPQPFITTDELREEFYKDFQIMPELENMIYTFTPRRTADYWLQKMIEHKERLIKEVGKLEPKCTCGCNWKDGCLCREKAVGYRRAKEDILRRLQSV